MAGHRARLRGRADRAAPGGDTFSAAALLPVLAASFYALAAIITRARCADERPLVLALGLNLGLLAAGLVASLGLSA